jgi:hypothetical protein
MIEKLMPYWGLIKLSLGAVLLIAAFYCGIRIEREIKDGEIAQITAARANDRAIEASAALKDLADASKVIHEAATRSSVNVASLGVKLDALQKEFKNANVPPLPVDCRPDAERVRQLAAAVDALKQAVTGQRTGEALPGTRRP